ncbi:MAG: hypothetical protein SGILL_002241 [Bacillariaceae sp.]
MSGSIRKSNALSTPNQSVINASSSKQSSGGCLEVELLQLTDLPYKDQAPLGVQFSIVRALGGDDKKKISTKVWSGPPTQRLRNGSSFRFAPGVLQLIEPLRSLYHSKLKVEVVYNANGSGNGSSTPSNSSAIQTVTYLQGEVNLRSLCIRRPKELKLKLQPTKAATQTNNDAIIADLDQTPTIRLRLQLFGPLRQTVQKLIDYLRIYTNLVDQAEDQLWEPVYKQAIQPILPMVPVGLGLGAVPVICTTLVVSPLIIGVSLLCFPITLPLVALIVLVAMGGASMVLVLLCSTRQGRAFIDCNVLQHDLLQYHVMPSPITQSVIYDTGNDDAIPNPVSVLRWYVVPEGMWYRLFFSLAIDLIGSCSYLIPGIGESFDGAWVSSFSSIICMFEKRCFFGSASSFETIDCLHSSSLALFFIGQAPIQSMLIMALYNQTTPNLKYVSLAEELLPFTDVLPSCTIGWATESMPGLLQDWKEVYEKGGGGVSGVAGLMRIGSDDSSSSSSSSSSSTSCDSSTDKAKKSTYMSDMQNYSARLSVKSP